jgi:hypothetical protein
MKAMREAASSLLAVHRWLTDEMGVKLAYSSTRMALARDKSDLIETQGRKRLIQAPFR